MKGCNVGNSFIPRATDIPKPLPPNETYNPFKQIYHIKIRNTKCPHIKVKVFDSELEALLDSGAGTPSMLSTDID